MQTMRMTGNLSLRSGKKWAFAIWTISAGSISNEDDGWLQPSFSVVSALEAWYTEGEELREE